LVERVGATAACRNNRFPCNASIESQMNAHGDIAKPELFNKLIGGRAQPGVVLIAAALEVD
jgi:hypothetical protein